MLPACSQASLSCHKHEKLPASAEAAVQNLQAEMARYSTLHEMHIDSVPGCFCAKLAMHMRNSRAKQIRSLFDWMEKKGNENQSLLIEPIIKGMPILYLQDFRTGCDAPVVHDHGENWGSLLVFNGAIFDTRFQICPYETADGTCGAYDRNGVWAVSPVINEYRNDGAVWISPNYIHQVCSSGREPIACTIQVYYKDFVPSRIFSLDKETHEMRLAGEWKPEITMTADA